MFRVAISILIYLGAARSEAMNFETHFYKAFARAKTSAQITKIAKDYERWKVTHAACLIEIRERTLPTSCYEELQWTTVPAQKRGQAIARLDRICIQAARRLSTPLSDHPALSSACAKEVREARAIQAYRLEDMDQRWSEN